MGGKLLRPDIAPMPKRLEIDLHDLADDQGLRN